MGGVRSIVPAARLVFSDEDRRRILAMIDQSLQSGSLTLGPHTKAFEREFARRHGARFAVATSSGTSSLEIVLRAVGVSGTDVVVPTNTFYATAGAVMHAGGRPQFADVDAVTMALSVASVEAALTPTTSAVVIVHIGGVISPAVAAIRSLLDERGITLIEDAAHAHGSTLNGKPAGSFGVAAAFSFYPTKVVTSAEGGMVLTHDEHLADEAAIYRDQGKAGFHGGEHVRLGYAWRLSELQAAVGLVQTERLEEFVEHRRSVAARYDEALAEMAGITSQAIPIGCRSNYYKYIALLDHGLDRAAVKTAMRERCNVQLTGEVYARPLHREPVFAGLAGASLPIADDVCARHVCLPIHSDMGDAEVEQVIESLAVVLGSLDR
ncbi:MAG: perosamine synthetase [Acidimicrobiaceae bacterium]|nr:perosamine synthetase [Acidimicrobiaceae bacterium]